MQSDPTLALSQHIQVFCSVCQRHGMATIAIPIATRGAGGRAAKLIKCEHCGSGYKHLERSPTCGKGHYSYLTVKTGASAGMRYCSVCRSSYKKARRAERGAKPRTKIACADGETRSIKSWARIRGIAQATLTKRLKSGMPFDQALALPTRREIERQNMAARKDAKLLNDAIKASDKLRRINERQGQPTNPRTVDPSRPWFVYSLADPESGDIRYIGKTCNIKQRLTGHISSSRCSFEANPYKARWIQQLMNKDLKPLLSVLENGIGETWETAEKYWISFYLSAGAKLTNLTKGGEGPTGAFVGEATRKKLSERFKGRIFTPEWKAKISAAKKGILTPAMLAQVQRLHAKSIGRVQTPEEKEKRAASLRGRKKSAESIAKTVAANTGKKRTPEQCDRMSKAQQWRSKPRA